jgi:hypothetical protein
LNLRRDRDDGCMSYAALAVSLIALLFSVLSLSVAMKKSPLVARSRSPLVAR